MDDLNTVNINQFDLLSAYLDNEVTLAERKQVERLLQSDPEFRQLYQQLLRVQRSCQAMPTPPSLVPVEQTVEQVMARIDARRRWPRWGMLGAVAILIGGGAGVLATGWQPKLATHNTAPDQITAKVEKPIANPKALGSTDVGRSPSEPESLAPDALMIRIDQPLIPATPPEPSTSPSPLTNAVQ